MMKFHKVILFGILAVLAGCKQDPLPVIPSEPEEKPEEHTWQEDLAKGAAKHGLDYIYDQTALPEIHLNITLDEWNRLLTEYDRNSSTTEQIHCDVQFIKNGQSTSISDAGIRLKGNTSRRRPEGSKGQSHKASGADWHHVHFQLNFHKFVKDDNHKIHGAKKVILKWFHEDPMYVREPFCYDEFRNFGVWTASWTSYCRLFLHIDGDKKETYYGVYSMIEPVDEDYLKVRKAATMFGESGGNLWKCRYGSSLNDPNADMGADLDDGKDHVYELKTNTENLQVAKTQLKNLISKIKSLSGNEFKKWIGEHCDVEMLLRTYAVNVAVGMWDDYWNNSNNWYLYFNSTDPYKYKFYMIPYDYDNTLGTTHNCGVQNNAGKHDPFNWGDNNRNPLIFKILQIPEWREMYKKFLLEEVDIRKDGTSWQASSANKIRTWHRLISPYISNDTGEDCQIIDCPASWSSRNYYRLLEASDNNWFKIKTQSIRDYCK